VKRGNLYAEQGQIEKNVKSVVKAGLIGNELTRLVITFGLTATWFCR